MGDEKNADFWDFGCANRIRKASSVREGTLGPKYSISDIDFGGGGGDIKGLGNKSRE